MSKYDRRFIVSVVMLKLTNTGYNTRNKLYSTYAENKDEALGNVIPVAQDEYPEHSLHTICYYDLYGED